MLHNNLDMVFLSPSLFHLATFRVGDDSFGSDHPPVLCSLDATLQRVRSGSKRYNIKNLDWPGFRSRCDDLARDLLQRLELLDDPCLIYEGFLSGVFSPLEACLPGRLINFTSFFTAKRNLFFSSTDSSPRVCGMGVPQGGVLSPILFNLRLRLLNGFLPSDVRAAMYAGDLLLYVRGTDTAQALGLLESAMDSLTPWPPGLGLSILIP